MYNLINMQSQLSIEDFFKEKGLDYYPRLIFPDGIEQKVRKKCRKALKRGLIDRSLHWFGFYYAREYEKSLIPKCTIQWMNGWVGYGVFALQDIPRFTYIGEYTGVVRRRKRLFFRRNDYCFNYEISYVVRSPFLIDAENGGNFTRFINHSDTPNLESIGMFLEGMTHIILRSTRKIVKGEQLTYDYGEDYWKK